MPAPAGVAYWPRLQARASESEIARDPKGGAMTEAEKLEQEIQLLLDQYRLETDLKKKRLLFERRTQLRKKWLRMTIAKDPPR